MCSQWVCSLDIQDTNFIDDERLEVQAKKSGLEKGKEELVALNMCGTKLNVSYCGIEHCALPTIRLQVSRFRFQI